MLEYKINVKIQTVFIYVILFQQSYTQNLSIMVLFKLQKDMLQLKKDLIMLASIIEEAKTKGLDKFISGQETFGKVLEFRDKQFVSFGGESVSINLPFNLEKQKKETIEGIANKVKEEHNLQIDIQVTQSLDVGDTLPNFGQIDKVFQQGKSELAAKPGQVLLIDVWATWCGPCQNPMQHNQKMLEKHGSTWGDKVRIVGVSVDDQVQSIKNRVTSKGWKNVQHLTLNGWNGDHDLIKGFSISGIPFVCLVDTHGKINYTGHPSQVNLQQKINQLLKGQSKTQQKKQEKQQKSHGLQFSGQQGRKFQETLGNEEFFKQKFANCDYICSKVLIKTTAAEGKTKSQAKAQVYVKNQNKQLLQQYQKLLPSKNIKYQGKIVKSIKTPQVPANCCECKGELSYPLYWCKWSSAPNDFRCRGCVQKKVDDLHFSYNDNSILIVEKIQQIPSAFLGQNLQPQKQNIQNLSPHSFGCNGCGGCPSQVGTARYICIGCRTEPNHRGDYIDLCQPCLIKLMNKDQDVIQALKSDGYKSNYPFLRILYNTNGYYKF